MKKIIISILLIFLTLSSFATNYYFANSGSDAGSGTIGSPYQTITKLNSIFGSLTSGDSVLFKRGDTFFGTINPHQGVNYDAYGSGGRPIISGFDVLSGWVNNGGGIYYATDANLGASVNLITLNNTIQICGRYPRTTWLTYTANTANTSITGPVIPFTLTANRAQVVIRKNHFIMDKGTVTNQTGGVLTYTGTSTVSPTVNFGFFVQNDLGCLTTLGDWMYDATTHRVYMYFGGGGPAGVIKASRYTTIFNFTGQTNVSIKNLTLEGSNNDAITGGGSNTNLKFVNSKINNAGRNGVLFQSSNAITVRNDSIYNCNNQAVIILYTNGTKVNFNIVKNHGVIEGAGDNGYGTTGWGNYGAITVGANDPAANFSNHIDSNIVINAGYIGLHVNGDSFTCNYNYVDSTCYKLDDGGGIYSFSGSPGFTYSTRIIDHNIVSRTLGAQQGTDGSFRNQGNGIYLDDVSTQVSVTNNTVFTSGNYGLFCHNANTITITGNTLYNNTVSQLAIIHDNIYTPSLPRVFAISGNYMIGANSTQKLFTLQSTASNSTAADVTSFGTASNNRYASVSASTTLFQINVTGYGSNGAKTFAQWQTATMQEGGSNFQNISVATLFHYNNSLLSIIQPLANTYKDLNNIPFPAGSYTLPAFNSKFLIFVSSTVPPVFSYSPSTNIYTLGVSISPLTPIVTTGPVVSYAAPALPTGLGINTSTGVISGTPTVLTPATNYTINATNSSGTGSTNINLTVRAALPNVTYPTPNVFVVGTPVSLTPTNIGGAVVSYSVSSLPLGLNLNVVTGVISGTPTAVSSTSTYTVTATNGTGSQNIPIVMTVNSTRPNISYSPASYVFSYGTAITAVNPVNIGGPIITYSISPALSSGLSFNISSGSITGTPTIIRNITTYSIIAVNSGGRDTTPLTLTINQAPLIITSNNKSKVQGAVNPTLTVSYSGFKNGDNNSVFITQPTITTTALTGSPTGTYPISANGALAVNYSFAYVPGVLSITSPSQGAVIHHRKRAITGIH